MTLFTTDVYDDMSISMLPTQFTVSYCQTQMAWHRIILSSLAEVRTSHYFCLLSIRGRMNYLFSDATCVYIHFISFSFSPFQMTKFRSFFSTNNHSQWKSIFFVNKQSKWGIQCSPWPFLIFPVSWCNILFILSISSNNILSKHELLMNEDESESSFSLSGRLELWSL